MGVWLRRLAGTTAATIVASTALVLSTPAQACACGAFLLPEDADEDAEPVEAEVELDSLVFLDVDDALQVQRIDDHLSYTYCIDAETGEVTGMTVIDGAEEAEDSDGCEW